MSIIPDPTNWKRGLSYEFQPEPVNYERLYKLCYDYLELVHYGKRDVAAEQQLIRIERELATMVPHMLAELENLQEK